MSFEGLLGQGSAARQLLVYGVGYEIARAILGPVFTQIEYEINQANPLVEITPPDLADMVVRGILAQPDAQARAAKFGIDSDRFSDLVKGAGEPPGLVQVLEWWRRGFLPWDSGDPTTPSVVTAIRTGRIYNYWSETIQKAQFVPPSPADAVNAVQRNQVTLAEGIAMAYFGGLGVSALEVPAGSDTSDTETAFNVLLNTRGNPPSVGELLELAKRGIIPWGDLDPATKTPSPGEISFAQGIYEGDSKDKWLPYYARLADYLPPPRTIVSLLSKGAITAAQASQYFQDAGLSPDLAAAYIASATTNKTTKPKELSEANVITLLNDKLIDQPTAITFLEQLGYPTNEATILATTAQAAQTITDLKANVNRVRGYYVSHKIDRANAASALGNLGLDAGSVQALLAGWDIDRSANVRVLTPAQIADAWEYGIFTQAEAQAELGYLGYTPLDAWTVLSIKAKQPLPGKPSGPGGLVA